MTTSLPRLRSLILATVVGLAPAAQAAEIGGAGSGASLELTGLIEPGDEAKLSAALAEHPRPAGLTLSSLGGNVQAALALGTLVRREGLRTSVPDRAICASACGLVWLAGTPRAIGQEAHVGLHAAYLKRNGVSVETGAANALIGAYLSRLGFEDRAIVYLTSAAPDDMTWILASDRQRYGIAFESGPALASLAAPVPDEHFLSRPMALAGAIASAAVAAVDRLMGHPPQSATTAGR